MYQDLAGELTGVAAQARCTRRLLQRANHRHPLQTLPSALWEAGMWCMVLSEQQQQVATTWLLWVRSSRCVMHNKIAAFLKYVGVE